MNVVRSVFIAGLLALVISVLAVPAMVSPGRFLQVVKAEHQISRQFITSQAAARVLVRMLDMQDAVASHSHAVPPPAAVAPVVSQRASGIAIDTAVVGRLSQLGGQLLRNDYVRSLDGMLLLVTYRVSLAMELMPVVIIFMLVAFVDGSVLRLVRSRQFVAHSSETASLSAAGGVALVTAGAVMLVVPVQLHPMFFLAVALLSLYAFSRFIAHYHVIR